MLKSFVAYLATLIAVMGLDLLFLGVVAKNFYKSALGSLMLDSPVWPAAIAFYVFYPLGVLIFVVHPALAAGSDAHAWMQVAWRGALFGFFAYMTYEFTNLALIRAWPASIVAVDILWGMFLTACAATAGYFTAKLVS